MKINKLAAAVFFLAPAAWAQTLAGVWDATLRLNGTSVPFRLEITGSGSDIRGSFFNGDDRETSASGSFENGSLVLHFDSYAAVLRLDYKDGALDGEYKARGNPLPIHAVRSAGNKTAPAGAPNVDGLWYLENVPSSKGEKAWNLIVKQNGGEVRASILRIDGDTGTLEGSFDGSKFVLSHFDGARPALVHITPQADGTLAVETIGQRGGGAITAVRAEVARAQGLPLPTDPAKQASVKNTSQPFAFSFPDLDGTMVSNTDPRFQGKVLLINITGSWCPNCHDEAPFLAALYNKYKDQGLEIVALSFEEPEQVQNPTRLRAFIKQAGIRYTVLLGGETASAHDKLPDAQDWNSWPTTFFVGRNGLVRATHSGFPSKGSGDLYKQETQDFVATVEKLLAENQTSRK